MTLVTNNANMGVLGTTPSNVKDVASYKGEIAAGKLVRLKSDGTISTAKADGAPLGVSLGRDLSNAGYTAIVCEGRNVPVLLTAGFTPTLGAGVYISDTTGMAKASATDSTAVNATFTGLLSDGALSEDGLSTPAAALITFAMGL